MNATTAPKDQWNPNILISPGANGLHVKFYPPFPGADHHEICILKFPICMGNILKVKDTTTGGFIQGVPYDQQYRVMVRPYDADGHDIGAWISKDYFYPSPAGVEATTHYVSNEKEVTYISSTQQTNNSDNIIITSVVVVLLVLIMLLFILIYRRQRYTLRSVRNYFRYKRYRNQSTMTVIPVFIPSSQSFINMVDEHLKILERTTDVQIQKSPFILEVECENVVQNIDMWVASNISFFVNNTNYHIIIYVSNELLRLLEFPQDADLESREQICLRLINRLSDELKRNRGTKKPFVVCFGCENDFNMCPPLNQFQDLISAVKLPPNSHNVSIEGTKELLNRLFPSEADRSNYLTLEETKELQTQFRIHISRENPQIISSDSYSEVNELSDAVQCHPLL